MKENTKKPKHSWYYRNSLSIVFICLFLTTLFAQAYTGFKVHNDELNENNMSMLTFGTYLKSGHFISATFENFESEFLQMALYVVKPNFWFETFQNWQSEFLSVASIVIFTIYLRQKGSPESKPVDTPNLETED